MNMNVVVYKSNTIIDDLFKYKIYMKNETPLGFIQKLKDNDIIKIKVSRFYTNELFTVEGDHYQVDENSRIWKMYSNFRERDEVIRCYNQSYDYTDFVIDRTVTEKKEVFDLPSYETMVETVTVVYDIDNNIWRQLGKIRLAIEYFILNNKYKEKRKISTVPKSFYFVPCE